jgi:predicted transcriptional regulator
MMEKSEMRNLNEVLRDEMLMHKPIYNLLKTKPMTIPELAQALDKPSWEITVWIMSMRRYGLITELTKSRAEDYFQYTTSSEEPA